MNATWRCRYIAPMVSRTAGASAQLASRSELDAVLSFEMAARQIVRAGERDERHLALQVHRTDGVAHGGRERPVGIQIRARCCPEFRNGCATDRPCRRTG